MLGAGGAGERDTSAPNANQKERIHPCREVTTFFLSFVFILQTKNIKLFAPLPAPHRSRHELNAFLPAVGKIKVSILLHETVMTWSFKLLLHTVL